MDAIVNCFFEGVEDCLVAVIGEFTGDVDLDFGDGTVEFAGGFIRGLVDFGGEDSCGGGGEVGALEVEECDVGPAEEEGGREEVCVGRLYSFGDFCNVVLEGFYKIFGESIVRKELK